MKNKYDYLIVGAGLYGAIFAFFAKQVGKSCLVIDRRSHIGGNIYCENIEGINVHKYGAHIFHTSNEEVWKFVNQFVSFNNYINSPMANYKGDLYNLPFNMNTFYQLWGVKTPAEAKAMIESQKKEFYTDFPKNLEEQAINLVGKDVYEKLIKGYTEKQWGRKATDIPGFIIKRLPVRFTFDNNYFNDRYQGVPIGGYNVLINGLLKGTEVKVDTDYLANRNEFSDIADKILFTGGIDQFFDYQLGHLQYRSLRFENELLDIDNFQGNAVINYTDAEVPYTRIIEHKHFEFGQQPKTFITREYSLEYEKGLDPYYPINDDDNNLLFEQYRLMAQKTENVIFGGRLGNYKYYDMDKVIEQVLKIKNLI